MINAILVIIVEMKMKIIVHLAYLDIYLIQMKNLQIIAFLIALTIIIIPLLANIGVL